MDLKYLNVTVLVQVEIYRLYRVLFLLTEVLIQHTNSYLSIHSLLICHAIFKVFKRRRFVN